MLKTGPAVDPAVPRPDEATGTTPGAAAGLAPGAPPGDAELHALRAELDGIDDALHDLLLRRTGVVERVGRLGGKGPVKLRPGREAAIVRRLLARHAGPFPPSSLHLVWREIICGMTAVQSPLRIAVCEVPGAPGLLAAAREHFGALVPLRTFSSPAQALREVGAGRAAAAVLPVPQEGEDARDAWWTALLHRDEPRIHVVARLPFWTARPEGSADAPAFVVTAAAPDPSGLDRSLLGLEIAPELSRARLGTELAAAGFTAGPVILRRDAGAPRAPARALVEVEGFVPDADPRLLTLSSALLPPVVLGTFPVPLEFQR